MLSKGSNAGLEVCKVRGGCNHSLEAGQGDGFSSELGFHFGFQFLQRYFEHHVVGDGGAGEGAEVNGVLGNTTEGDQVVDVGLVGVDQGGDVGQTVDVVVERVSELLPRVFSAEGASPIRSVISVCT